MRALFLLLVAAACSGPGKNPTRYSQAQLNAIETREVEATADKTFDAATSAMLDAGYAIIHSDKNAGILTGTRMIDRTAQRIFISGWIRDSHYTLTLQIRKLERSRSSARIKLAYNGQARVDKKTIDKVWVLMKRQVLMNDPPDIDLSTAPRSTK